MAHYIEVKTKVNKQIAPAGNKVVTEIYLINAESCTEAEARVTEDLSSISNEEFTIDAIKKSNISEIVRKENCDFWYRAKVNFFNIDEKTGVEKKNACHYLVQGEGFDNAYRNLVDFLKTSLADYEIAALSETMVVDVYSE